MRIREKLYRFMQGRYGVDQLSKFLLIVGIIVMLMSSIFSVPILYYVSLIIVIYAYIRTFSKNINKRYGENQKYLYYAGMVKKRFSGTKTRLTQSKTHRFFKCPSCKQKIRVPKGKGKIEITCPKCHTKFVRKS